MALEKELETYRSKLAELLPSEGKYVLIHGGDVVDTFAAYEDALKAGYQRFGLKPFMVKQILAIEPVYYSSRSLANYSKAI